MVYLCLRDHRPKGEWQSVLLRGQAGHVDGHRPGGDVHYDAHRLSMAAQPADRLPVVDYYRINAARSFWVSTH